MSIGENWLAPQPTANIANAILIQAPVLVLLTRCLLLTIVAVMPSTLTRKLSNSHLTVAGLGWGHGSGCRPGLGGHPDGRPAPRADAADPAGWDAAVGFGPGRGGRHLPVAGQRAPEEAGGRRAGDPHPARARAEGPLARRREPGQEPALGPDVLRPPGGRGRGLGHRGADRARPGPRARRGLRAGAGRRRGVRPPRHR